MIGRSFLLMLICNILVSSTETFKARTPWERGYAGDRNGQAISQSLTQATWHWFENGSGCRMLEIIN